MEKNQNEIKPMKFTAHCDAYVDYDGYEYKEYNSEFESPFITSINGLHRYCWVIYRGLFGTYRIRECYVSEIVYTDCWLWRMDNGWTFFSGDLGKKVFLHDQLDIAIKICEEKNRMKKVKVKYIR